MAAPSSRLRAGIVVVVLASLAAIAATYFLFFRGDSPPPLQLSTPEPTTGATSGASPTTAAAQAAGAPEGGVTGRWSVGQGSTVGYRVREKLARLPAQNDAVGRTTAVTGAIEVGQRGSDLVVAAGSRFEADVTQLTSDEPQRDNRIRTQGLQSNQFPTATFVATAPVTLPAAAAEGASPVKAEATGDLTIHGVTKRVTIPLDAQLTGARIEVVGSLRFPFSDFGMSPPNIAGFVTVDEEATLEFQLFFDKQ
ncbi:MAG: YceI family protein [Actinomycetota bacterium]